jgi:hypothetical protein
MRRLNIVVMLKEGTGVVPFLHIFEIRGLNKI